MDRRWVADDVATVSRLSFLMLRRQRTELEIYCRLADVSYIVIKIN